MKSIVFLILICSINPISLGQNDTVFIRKATNPYSNKIEYKTDTVIFNNPNLRNILIGNDILTQTLNQQNAKGSGLFFEKFQVKDCTNGENAKPNKILDLNINNGSWTIKAIVYENCCQDFLADISVEDNKTLNLIYYNYGSYCSCSCKYEITYTIQIKEYEGLRKIKSVMVNGDKQTKIKL